MKIRDMKQFLLLLAFFSCMIVKAQTFEGVITYKISYPTINDKAYLVDKPTEMLLSVKGNMIRSDINYNKYSDQPKVPPTPVSQSRITDLGTKSFFELLSVGKDVKFLIETTTKQIEELLEKQPAPNIVVQDSTRMICGYLCKIAVLTLKIQNPFTGEMEDKPFTIYYTESLGNRPIYIDKDLREINGLMLDFTIYASNIPIRFTASKIKKKKLKEELFTRPVEGYQKDVERDRVQYLLNGGK